MSSEFGKNVKITVFGESHGSAVGVVIDGLPAGEEIDCARLQAFLARRRPGQSELTSGRNEADEVVFLSGIYNSKTCGTPLTAVIENKNAVSEDYSSFCDIPRPSHADYPAFVKYKGNADMRGGGHFSGRLTAPVCIAGGIAMQILERRGIYIGAHISSVGEVEDSRFDSVNVSPSVFQSLENSFPVLDKQAGERIKKLIGECAAQGDSVGGTVECAITGLAAGLGEVMFGSLESKLAEAFFGIPGLKGIEFGSGFSGSRMRGSENNDAFIIENGEIKTRTNNHGGILGGLTSSMPVVFRVAFKPTPSIAIRQNSVDLRHMTEMEITVGGRHDPCIALRAVPVAQAVAACVILDMTAKEEK